MFKKLMVHVGNKVWGQMPSGEIKQFNSPFEYNKAYKEEEDEIADELARLEALKEIDDLQNDRFMTA